MIKSEVVTNARVDNNYPKLMITGVGDIVLFQYKGAGTVILACAEEYMLGDYDNKFDMRLFTDFEGTITLSNGSE